MLAQVWRHRPATVISACIALEVLLFVYTRTAGAHLNSAEPVENQVLWLLLDLFLLYRIRRGGSLAWGVLLGLQVLALLAVSLGVVVWDAYVVGLMSLAVAQPALLLSPAVRRRVFGQPARAPGLAAE